MTDYSLVFGAGAACAYLIRFLQRSKYFPWITAEGKRINIVAQAVLSFLATVGITWSWNAKAGTLVIAGLSLHAIAGGAFAWFQQFAVQHGFTQIITMGQVPETNKNGSPPPDLATEKKL